MVLDASLLPFWEALGHQEEDWASLPTLWEEGEGVELLLPLLQTVLVLLRMLLFKEQTISQEIGESVGVPL